MEFPVAPDKLARAYNKVLKFGATHSDLEALLQHAQQNPDQLQPGSHLRSTALPDALRELDRHDEADLLQNPEQRVFVHDGQIRPVPKTVQIRGRRWFQRTYGNTYHTAEVSLDGKHALTVPRTYGYGNQYLETALNQLEKSGLVPPREHKQNGFRESLWAWAGRHGMDIDHSAVDVPRQRDL